jgi:hypothetical protein
MPLLRDELARFIQAEGHRVEVAAANERSDRSEILFRTRGYVFSVLIREEPSHFEIATAYEIPPWARERAQNATTLADVAVDVGDVRFTLAPNGKNFVVTLDCGGDSLAQFERAFWPYVARVREAGVAALEQILDRSESRAAANKFITSLTRRE